ncbi:hypothetical protein EIN_223480 [Entamoeba invadens IP1]|uniref:Uncharacterized protein n=1 Tax=Entamoeba invadens IP1 TaxID=370355 RepID=A0A0A1U5L5_ENTIV|nr:hypothetical protein EIN_223480 [Entamoeba invadens IP1]ELP88145.1 hypothetical protein EIN_223480 [Entamoeba invadens IP1]|eukprot:XP_004254916.1 hypothetical protein EIN_223480 [Entamoeba invadens IP1]
MEGVGRDFIDNSIRTPYEKLRNNFEKKVKEITYQDKQLSCEMTFSFIKERHQYFLVPDYYFVDVKQTVSTDVLSLFLSACKQAYPKDTVIAQSNTKIIGIGLNNKKYAADTSHLNAKYSDCYDFAKTLFEFPEECVYSTTHKYFIKAPIKEVTKMTYAKGLNYFENICLEASVDNMRDYLFTQNAVWILKVVGSTNQNATFYHSRLLEVQSMLQEAEKLKIERMCIKSRTNTKVKLIDFLLKDCTIEKVEFGNVAPNSLFSLYCQYVLYRKSTLLKHRTFYKTFIQLVKQFVSVNTTIWECNWPSKNSPFIHQILCLINFLLSVKNNTFESCVLPEIGVDTGFDKLDYELVISKDVNVYLVTQEGKTTSFESFMEWYMYRIIEYNTTHPTPLHQRNVLEMKVMDTIYQTTKKDERHPIEKCYYNPDTELEKCIQILENVSVSHYYLDYVYTITQTTQLLLTSPNDLFNPTQVCHTFFHKKVEKSVNDICELQKKSLSPNTMSSFYKDPKSPSCKIITDILNRFKKFETRFFIFHDLELRVPGFDERVCSIVDILLKQKDTACYQQNIGFSKGIDLVLALGDNLLRPPNEYEWTIKDKSSDNKLKVRYIVTEDDVTISMSWVD